MRSAIRVLAVSLLMVLACPTTATASMSAAEEAYRQKDWRTAAQRYEALAADGLVHEELFYNLGNAHLQGGALGPAIYAYERALRLSPAHVDAQANLALARRIVAERTTNQLPDAQAVGWWLQLARAVPIGLSTAALLLANAFFFAALASRKHWPLGRRRRAVQGVTSLFALTALVAGAVLAGHSHVRDNTYDGVVLADSAVMREGPDAQLEERGQLHPGLRIALVRAEPEWLFIRLGNGLEGWVMRSEVGLFR